MAVAPVVELPIPPAYAASFVNGEMALCVSNPISAAAGPATFYLSKWFDLEGGAYTITMVADDAATWRIGVDGISTRLVASNVIGEGVTTRQMFLLPGVQRLDIVLQNLAAGDCFVAFLITSGGKVVYASEGTDWVFDTAPIADADVPSPIDGRRRLPVFSVLPNWKDGVIERLSFLTDVMESEWGIEQRRLLRLYARRSLEASFLRKNEHRARLDSFFVGTGRNECLVPLWFEQFYPPGGLAIGQTVIEFPARTTQFREFRVGDLVFINDKNPNRYEIVEVESVDLISDSITLVAGPTETWSEGVRIIPLRIARMMESASFSNPVDRVGVVRARFEIEGDDNYAPDWGFCSPTFRFQFNRVESVQLSFDRKETTLDNGSGRVLVVDPSERTMLGQRGRLLLRGRRETVGYRKFLSQAAGRARRFYMPTGCADLWPVGDISGQQIESLPIGFTDYMRHPQHSRVTIGIVFNDGTPTVYRNIVDIAPVGAGLRPDTELFTLDRPIPLIRLDQIQRIQFMVPTRFDQDSFELHHRTSDMVAVSSGVVTRSVDATGMPPIDCFVTSKPYPLSPLEKIGFGCDLVSALTFVWPTDHMLMGCTLESASLNSLLALVEAPPESIGMTTAIVSGSLQQLLIALPGDLTAEELTFGTDIVSGTIAVKLINYPNWPEESLAFGCEITGGSLV